MWNKKEKIFIVCMLVVAALGITIGFAAFSAALNISASATMTADPNSFKIKFSKVSGSVKDGSSNPIVPILTGDITAENAIINNEGNPTIENLDAVFTQPGDSVKYEFYVLNQSPYLAYLTGILYNGNPFKECVAGEGADATLVANACSTINVKVTVGSSVYVGTKTSGITNTIESQSNEKVTVEITYNGPARADGPFEVHFGEIELVYSTAPNFNGANSGSGDSTGETILAATSVTNTLTLTDVSEIKNYRIYGTSSGVGDLDETTGMYSVPITVSGKNLLNIYTRTQYDMGGSTYSGNTTIRNFDFTKYYIGLTMNNYINTKQINNIVLNGDIWYLSTNSSGFGVGFPLKVNPNTNYYISGNMGEIGIGYYDSEGNYLKYYYTSSAIVSSFTTPENCEVLTVVFRPAVAAGEVQYSYVQLEEGTIGTPYEPYVEPKQYTINLNSPLMENDYIDYENQLVVRSDGKTESITIPELVVHAGTNIITVNTTNSTNNIEISYVK